MLRIVARPSLTLALTGFLAASLLLVPALAVPAQASVVPSPGLPGGHGAADPHGVALSLKLAASGFSSPVLVQTAPDGVARLFVVERGGLVKIYSSAGVRSTAYLNLTGRANSSGDERGLLGLVFSPHFTTDHHLWASYTDSAGALQVSRFTASSATASTVSASTELKVINVPHPNQSNHNAGMLAFGPGGNLYISTGDGGGAGDPYGNALDRSTLSGKILRIDPNHSCSGRNYCIPSSNPWSAPGGARGAIFAFGVRNPWRFSFDKYNGDLWIADVGQSSFEEVTRIPRGSSGWNLGWSCREGRSVYNSSRCSSASTYHDPTIVYGRGSGGAIIGGYVYRGTTSKSLLNGLYVFGDFLSGNLWVSRASTTVNVGNVGANKLTAFGQDGSGELWATTIDGGLYQVVASAS